LSEEEKTRGRKPAIKKEEMSANIGKEGDLVYSFNDMFLFLKPKKARQ